MYEGSYVVNIEIHICWDITNPCNMEVTVLDKVILYKQPCMLTTQFAVDGNCFKFIIKCSQSYFSNHLY